GLGGTTSRVGTGGRLTGTGGGGASGSGTGTLLGGAWAGWGGGSWLHTPPFDVWYAPTKNWQYWQRPGFAPAPAHGAACATPGAVTITENGANAKTAATAIPSAFIV
ncbi:MAG TPA: hypothetical protein VE441_06635, partial [Mycobacterium sp.]|nr:hypothetical protein [Mycobacterium sp.]